jgi:hypothetical protein
MYPDTERHRLVLCSGDRSLLRPSRMPGRYCPRWPGGDRRGGLAITLVSFAYRRWSGVGRHRASSTHGHDGLGREVSFVASATRLGRALVWGVPRVPSCWRRGSFGRLGDFLRSRRPPRPRLAPGLTSRPGCSPRYTSNGHASIRKCRQRVRRRSERFADVQERSSRPPLIGEMASASCDALGYEKVRNEG